MCSVAYRYRKSISIIELFVSIISMERVTKKQLEASFNACLLPRRSALGWHVDPERLLQILTFRYPFLQTPIHIKITGDGREYRGRQSTFVALTVLNNELLLQNVSFQSPKECFPLSLFYESDSRDNLEKNMTKPTNRLNQFVQNVCWRLQIIFVGRWDVCWSHFRWFREAWPQIQCRLEHLQWDCSCFERSCCCKWLSYWSESSVW